MRLKQNLPKEENNPPQEPVYVDEVFPLDEAVQDESWEIPARDDQNEEDEPEATLEDHLDENGTESEEIPRVQPSKPDPPPQKYRVKIPAPSSRRLPEQPRYSMRKPLSTTLPRPPRRDERREEQTGTWPVDPDAKRKGSTHPKNGVSHPIRPDKTPQKEQRSPPSAKSIPPIQRQPGNSIPPNPNPAVSPRREKDETSRESPSGIERRDHPRQKPVSFDNLAPPPVLPATPVKSPTPPRPVFPVEEENTGNPSHGQKPLNGGSFRPLVDEDSAPSEADEATTEEGWDHITPSPQDTNLHSLIERLQLPENSLILGVCDDGLPLVLEFSDPSPGALLFFGDDVGGLRNHLQAVLASISLLSDPKQVQVDVISPQPETFATQKLLPHVQKIHLPDQGEMFDLLACLFELIEQRQRKDNSLAGKLLSGLMPSHKGPVRILMIDQVDRLVEQLAPESLAYLRWLLRRGPAANVWVFASLNTQNTQNLDGKTLKSFGLRVAGRVRNSHQTTRLTDIPLEKLSSLEAGEACLKLDEEVISFSILNI